MTSRKSITRFRGFQTEPSPALNARGGVGADACFWNPGPMSATMTTRSHTSILDYASRPPERIINVCAVAAFLAGLFGCPCLRGIVRTRLFWDGHPLSPLAHVVDTVPADLLPITAVVLGCIGLWQARRAARPRGGKTLATSGLILGMLWELLLIAVRTFPFPAIGPRN